MLTNPLLNKDLINHGNAKPINKSNTFEPTIFETPISTIPSLTTIIDVYASGIDVP
jgi:hypothetical protein